MLTIAGSARFVSDLHLGADQPAIVERFRDFLADTLAQRVAHLFILGDLFEYWIGDDDLADPFNRRIARLLRDAADGGLMIHFLAGNRDFLLGDVFAQAAGMQRLQEPQKVGAGETAILLLHGDILCTDDVAYQEFRRRVRSSSWQEQFLARPLAQRRLEAAELRRLSTVAMQAKPAASLDVNQEQLRAVLLQSGCRRLIHGHTHRPGHQRIVLGAECAERWVLSDWEVGRGDALQLDATGISRLDWSGSAAGKNDVA